MTEKDKNKESGIILIDKDRDWTSFDVVAKLRNITGIKKIGHAGTLDPFATGLLIVAVGRESTKKIDDYMKLKKEYETEIFLGAVTETFDTESEIKNSGFDGVITEKKIRELMKSFIGEQEQIPPMFSAKKINGKKLYELARKGKTVARKKSKINIYNLELLSYKWPVLKIKVKCSTGTYIRSLGNDIGAKLGCGAYLQSLRRIKIGEFEVEKAHKIRELNQENFKDYFL
jgi:tRNA pseudouridine55 synthase